MHTRQKNLLFWILNTAGWSIYAMVYFLLLRKTGKSDDWLGQVLFLLTYLVGFSLTIILRYIFRIIRKRVRNIFLTITLVLTILLPVCFLWYWIDVWVSMFFWESAKAENLRNALSFMLLLRMTLSNYIPMLAWSMIYFGVNYWLEWQNEKKRTEEAMNLARKSQFEMLRYQLNPHFLFNSLNSARALIDEDPRAARDMITELSEFLRYSLVDKEMAFRPLRDELRALQHYLSIEKRRFEEKLLIEYDIAPETEQLPILGFLIHPIIENAIKYGMKTSETPLRLLIRTTVEQHYLMIRLCNSGFWIAMDDTRLASGEGTGTGLNNVQQRLENAYPGNHIFRIEKNDQQVCIIIGIYEPAGKF